MKLIINLNFGILLLIVLCSNSLHAQKVTKLYEAGKVDKAKLFCEKQKGENQKAAYTELAELFFRDEKMTDSRKAFAKSSNPEIGFIKLAEFYFNKKNYSYAQMYYKMTSKADEGNIRIGDVYLNKKNYHNAWGFYKKVENYQPHLYKIVKTSIKNKAWGSPILGVLKFDTLPSKEYEEIADIYFENLYFKAALPFYIKAKTNKDKLITQGNKIYKSKYPGDTDKYFKAALGEKDGNLKMAEKELAKNNVWQAYEYYSFAYKDEPLKMKKCIQNLTDFVKNNSNNKDDIIGLQARNIDLKFITEKDKINEVANYYLTKNSYSSAIKYFKLAENKESANKARIKYAEYYISKNKYPEAIKYYTLTKNEELINSAKQKHAEFLVSKGNFNEAIILYKELNLDRKVHECYALTFTPKLRKYAYPVIQQMQNKNPEAGQGFFDSLIKWDKEFGKEVVKIALLTTSDSLIAEYDRIYSKIQVDGAINHRLITQSQLKALIYKKKVAGLLTLFNKHYDKLMLELKMYAFLEKYKDEIF